MVCAWPAEVSSSKCHHFPVNKPSNQWRTQEKSRGHWYMTMTAFFCRDLYESTSSTCFTLLLRARQNVSATASFQLQSIRMQFHYLWFPVWSKKQLHRALAKHAGEENMYFTSIKRGQRILNIAIVQNSRRNGRSLFGNHQQHVRATQDDRRTTSLWEFSHG